MNKIFVFLCLVFYSLFGYSQNKSINPALPHYKILKADSTYTTWQNLKKNKPVMIVYFMPDCPHCQHLTIEMEQNMQSFKDMQIVMITDTKTEYPFMRLIRSFSAVYKLGRYKNITMGTEYPRYDVNDYYQLLTTPFIAIYNRSGKMIKYFDKPTKISEVIEVATKA